MDVRNIEQYKEPISAVYVVMHAISLFKNAGGDETDLVFWLSTQFTYGRAVFQRKHEILDDNGMIEK